MRLLLNFLVVGGFLTLIFIEAVLPVMIITFAGYAYYSAVLWKDVTSRNAGEGERMAVGFVTFGPAIAIVAVIIENIRYYYFR